MCTSINKKAKTPAEITQGSTKSIEIYCDFTESPNKTDENGVRMHIYRYTCMCIII